ncbi:MAG: hypothetical protein Q4F38_07850 [Akkermansia sp.]|nr:hypothetical protein [Akkermansia sp.]
MRSKLLPLLVCVVALSACGTQTVSRSELFTPNIRTIIDHKELTGMMYYGADAQYDYFKRGSRRLRVARSEKAIPSYARFPFDNWQTGRKYTECITDLNREQIDSIVRKAETIVDTLPDDTLKPRTRKKLHKLLQVISPRD